MSALNTEDQIEDREPLGDNSVPRIFFSKWSRDSRIAYLKAARKNMVELQEDYDRRSTRMNTLMIVNGTVLGLVLAFMVNSNMLETPEIRWVGAILVVGIFFLLLSFTMLVWTSTGAKEAPVMDFWVGAEPDAWDVIDDADLLVEDLMNGFLMRCEDLRYTVERTIDRTQTCGRLFAIGLGIIMIAVICALLFTP